MFVNKVTLIGNLTKDPELKTTPSGVSVCSFSLATNRSWFDKQSQTKKEEVEFHNLVAWQKTGELIAQYMKKGNQLYVEGRLQTRTWEGKDGKKNYRTEVVVENMQFGAKPAGTASAPRREAAPSDDFEASLNAPQDIPAASVSSADDINVEDIPF